MASLLEIIAAKNPQQAKNKLAELASNTKNAIFNQWQQGEPYRIASGALMMGDPATAKKVIEERFANTTPQDIYSAAQDVGVDFAQNPIAGGLAGIFAGVGAKTADVAKLGLAQEMKAQGIPDEVIHQKTGWFSGMPDGKWRFEIPDNAAIPIGMLKLKKQREIYDHSYGDIRPPIMSDALSHSELYDAYPSIGKSRVGILPTKDAPNAQFLHGSVSFNPSLNKLNMKSEGLHELQHAIQQQEGFATGGAYSNPEYSRLAGEAEARLTQARMNMTAKQRAASYPPSMFDVPVDQQIVRYGDGTSMSVPDKLVAQKGLFQGTIDKTRNIDVKGNDLFSQHASMPARAAVERDINMTVSPLENGKYVLQYRPLWGSSSKEFHIIGDDPNALALAGIDRLTRSDKAISSAQKAKFNNSLLGKLNAEFGDTFSKAKSTQSKSEYLIHNPTGIKIRISDHNLPLGYEQPDVDLRFGQSLEEKLSAIREAIK